MDNIIIYGDGRVGKALHKYYKKLGIKVLGFCEDSKEKGYLSLKEIKNKNTLFVIAVSDIEKVVNKLHSHGLDRWLSPKDILNNINSDDLTNYSISTLQNCHNAYLNKNKVFLKSLDLVITERCSLKCKECSNLMQYYTLPKNFNTEQILHSIDILSKNVDEINEVRLIGGEPLINKDWNIITKHLLKFNNIKNVIIYTNGTIVPTQIQLEKIKDYKLMFSISNYEKLSKNINKLKELLHRNNIRCEIKKVTEWTDCGIIKKHNRSSIENNTLFKECCVKNLFTLIEYKLYRCPFSANLNNLKRIKEDRVINIKDKDTILPFLHSIKAPLACDYCNGRLYTSKIIKVAEQ